MNIGIFTDSFTPEVNGVVTSLQLFIAAFRQRGHDVFIFAPNDGFKKKHLFEINVRRYPSILILGKQVRLAVPMIRAHTVASLNLDIIHVQTFGPIGFAGARVGKKLRIPLVYTYHTRVERYAHYYLHLPYWLERGLLTLVAKRFYSKHDFLVAPSEGIKKELEKYVAKPVVVIPTGVDIETNRRLADKNDPWKILEKHGLKSTDGLLITAGRIGKEKNFRFVVDVFPKIKMACPNAKLLVAGDGPDKESLMEYAQKIVNQKDIVFLDFLKHEELFSLYKVAKIFLFASLTETQGMVILEAMTLGLPVVALSSTGVEDLMAGDIGGFMTKNSVEDFVQKTIRLLKEKSLWENKSREALRRAQDFSIEKMTEKTVGLYRELVEKNRAKQTRAGQR